MNPHAKTREHKTYPRAYDPRVRNVRDADNMPSREKIVRRNGRKDWQ